MQKLPLPRVELLLQIGRAPETTDGYGSGIFAKGITISD
jgi:hypothetical protein